MVMEKGDGRVGYAINMFLEKSLLWHFIEMMDHFIQILRLMLTTSNKSWIRSNHFGTTAHFNVQVTFDILVFEYHIDVDTLHKWLSVTDNISINADRVCSPNLHSASLEQKDMTMYHLYLNVNLCLSWVWKFVLVL